MTALMTTADVAERLGISTYTLRAWCNENPPRISHIRIGNGRFRFAPEHVAEFQEAHLVPAGRMVRTDRSQRVHKNRN